jgi:alkanesulfonate monooxygenase SsuD/methylene tetrahydromethanopterin reductase-like flavin-dependent oxidoreductase (luciferase family)
MAPGRRRRARSADARGAGRARRGKELAVRVHWFHLMPYQALPPDFSTTYRSVWVDPPSHLFDPAAANRMYNEYLDELEFADQMGFDGICVNEHHQNAYGMMPSPNLMAAALARRTRHAALVVMGDSIALYNPPTRVAEEFAMLDCLSGGRLVAGFPVGTSMDSNYAYGQTPATLREKYDEAHTLIMRAWTDPEVFSFNGKYTQLRYVNIWPRPLQRPHPPVWVPGGGSVETWEWVARREYLYAYLSYSGYKRGQGVMNGYWAAMDRLGYPRNPYSAGFAQLAAVAETDAQAKRDYAEAVEYFYDKCLHVFEGFADAPGYRTLKTIEAGLLSQVGAAARRQWAGLTWDELVEQGNIVAGSPETVLRQLRQVVRSLNVGHLMLLLHFGNLSRERTLKNTELFARHVLPELKQEFADWEDRWYPRFLQDRAAPSAPPVVR